jgi:RNA polymerase sigma-70 factor (ECF subfamily)
MAALERVPLQRRAVLVMHDLDGFSIVDVAAKLSITRFGAYARLRKARKELASALRRLLARGYADEVR